MPRQACTAAKSAASSSTSTSSGSRAARPPRRAKPWQAGTAGSSDSNQPCSTSSLTPSAQSESFMGNGAGQICPGSTAPPSAPSAAGSRRLQHNEVKSLSLFSPLSFLPFLLSRRALSPCRQQTAPGPHGTPPRPLRLAARRGGCEAESARRRHGERGRGRQRGCCPNPQHRGGSMEGEAEADRGVAVLTLNTGAARWRARPRQTEGLLS